MNYRTLIYACTLLTGATGLLFQTCWQKYLSYIVGSEARSSSLVIACFLLGLAFGYRFWGRFTRKGINRYALLKIYAFIELGIGGWAILFPSFFPHARTLAFALPDMLATDLLITCLLILPPTFLMGATIPLLTAVVPDRMDEVNGCHARIYGINTLGAFFGAVLGGFLILPNLGLPMSLTAGGAVNLAAAVVFLFNTLPHRSPESSPAESISIPSSLRPVDIYAYVLTCGAVTIALEILFFRIIGLTMGMGFYVFPIVVGIFVLGLALGSLSIPQSGMSLAFVQRELIKAIALLVVIFLTIPLWPLWNSDLRVSLTTIPSNYPVYLFVSSLLFAVFLIPTLLSLGRLLPLGYALIDKNRDDYAAVCGRLYFYNTLGTVLGSVFFGYLLLQVLALDTIFRLAILLIVGLLGLIAFRDGARKVLAGAGVALLCVMVIPRWDRSLHSTGLFRIATPQQFHFSGFFRLPNAFPNTRPLFLRDGPDATISVTESEGSSYSIVTNGKSDGNTLVDHSTMTLAGSLPYLHAPDRRGLRAAVIGLGTGITAGVLAKGADIGSVNILEISDDVIAGNHFFANDNGHVLENPRVSVIKTDAFKYFTRKKDPFDIIVSEPSNPWVVGIENLYTTDFYEIMKSSLTGDGVLFQWIQVYEMSQEVFGTLAAGVQGVFPYVQTFWIGSGDIGILASKSPIDPQALRRRFQEPGIRENHSRIPLPRPELLDFISLSGGKTLSILGKAYGLGTHELEFPRAAYASAKSRFLNQMVDPLALSDRELARWLRPEDPERPSRITRLLKTYPEGVSECANRKVTFPNLCRMIDTAQTHWKRYQGTPGPENLVQRLQAYRELRTQVLVSQDIPFLESLERKAISDPDPNPDHGRQFWLDLIQEYTRELRFGAARALLSRLQEAKKFSPGEVSQVSDKITAAETRTQAVLEDTRPGSAGPR